MTSLLGLYDLFVETGDPATGSLFTEGIKGLRAMLPVWDYRKRWSWYGSRFYLCPPPYHWLNRALLEVLGRLTLDPVLAEYAEAWKPEHLSALQRTQPNLALQPGQSTSSRRGQSGSFPRKRRAHSRAPKSDLNDTPMHCSGGA